MADVFNDDLTNSNMKPNDISNPIKKKSSKSSGKPEIYVTTLGDFSITVGKNTISDKDAQSKKPWIMLEYLITFRKRQIPVDELTNLIWNDDKSRNPQGALKTLIFRSRQLLDKLEIPSHSIVVQRLGTYTWDNDTPTTVDSDLFENLANKVLNPKTTLKTPEAVLDTCLQALDLYNGDYLSKSKFENWVVPISAYYHSLFQQLMYKALELLIQKEDHDTIIRTCEKAISIEPYDEEFHYNLIYSLYQNGEQKKALDSYNKVTEMFYTEFAVTPSERFKSLYKMIQDTEHGITTDLSVVQDRLREETSYGGAYYCEYSVFKDIYQLEQRSIERTGDSIYIALITLSDSQGDLFKPVILARAMEELGSAIRSSLRRGDVYARFSISQYLILLPTASYENADMVLKRIVKFFKKEYTRKDMNIQSSLMSIGQDLTTPAQ